MNELSQIARNYYQVLERIHKSATAAGRDPSEIKLVVVTKTHPLDVVKDVIAAGAKYLGENYAEEALPKISGLKGSSEVTWHMIGHVQSRKAEIICDYFDYIHSLDSLKLAVRLDRFAREKGKILPTLLECNLAGEETKYGWPIWQEQDWPRIIPEVDKILSFSGLDVRGLMGMAPFYDQPEPARPYFRQLRRFREFLAREFSHLDWSELSMGMSGDFEVAIQEGATWVRIGTSILGQRKSSNLQDKVV